MWSIPELFELNDILNGFRNWRGSQLQTFCKLVGDFDNESKCALEQQGDTGHLPSMLAFQCENHSTGHVLHTAIRLAPVPFFTKDFRNMSPTLISMPVDDGLNQGEIFFGNCSFSDSDGQHIDRISEGTIGRQEKMHRSQKNCRGK